MPANRKGTNQGILKGKYHCTVDLLFYWFGISCLTTDNFSFYLQNRLIQTSQTVGQWYSDTSPFSIPCTNTLAYYGLERLITKKNIYSIDQRLRTIRVILRLGCSVMIGAKTFCLNDIFLLIRNWETDVATIT